MTQNEALSLLKNAVDAGASQSEVARRLGYSPTAISQALSGKYAGSLEHLLARVIEVYGNRQVDCPVLGVIMLGRCAEERKRPFSASNPVRVRLWQQCKKCEIKNNVPLLPIPGHAALARPWASEDKR
jgi:transcriptional regulator with XRE-family HTH domain